MPIVLLIDSGNYFSDNDNLGDRAIYQVIYRRLRQLWPDAEVQWITRNAAALRSISPDIAALELSEERQPLQELPGRLPQPAAADTARILAALHACDMVLATGGGYFSDSFASHAWSVLDTLEAGVALGKPAAIMSCGFEPVGVRSLHHKAISVLPRLFLVACREPLLSPSVVRSFGVPDDRVMIAGDEAIELAYEARPIQLGSALGINLREADYAGVTAAALNRLHDGLRQVFTKLAAPVRQLPISLFGPSDSDTIARLMAGIPGLTTVDANVTLPSDVIREAGLCRLVVTGSYHAAVFALSQGVPVVALAYSPHYWAKFQGLRLQFGEACRVLPMDVDEAAEALPQEIELGWRDAEEARQELLLAARRQIAASDRVYERVRQLAASAPTRAPTTPATAPSRHAAGPSGFHLSPHEMETFRTQGYLGPFRAFETSEMERVLEIIRDRVLPTPTPYCPFGLRLRHLDSRTIFDLCSAPPIVERMAALYGPDLILWNSNLFNKPPAQPGHVEEYPWHQDHYNWNMEPILNISAWLAITPATIENGCVEVIPGSHRQMIPAATDTDPAKSLRFGGVASDPAYIDETKKVAMVLEPGQFFLFNERLLHHSNPNRSGTHRLGLAVRATVPIVRVSEPFPCVLLRGQDTMGFNHYVQPPAGEPDSAWVASLPGEHQYSFDRPIPGKGWHLLENDGQHRFAWTGLEPEAWLDFRPVGPGEHVLRCEVLHRLSEEAVNKARVLVNGEPVTILRTDTEGIVTLEARVSESVLRARPQAVRITLIGPCMRPCDVNPASKDKRRLGLGVRRISLAPSAR
jgi:polysaccharide pyruvyl transferase WcaK-like protein